MAIADKLVEVNNVKQNIKQFLIDKEVDMNDIPFTEYPTKLYEMPSGGGDDDEWKPDPRWVAMPAGIPPKNTTYMIAKVFKSDPQLQFAPYDGQTYTTVTIYWGDGTSEQSGVGTSRVLRHVYDYNALTSEEIDNSYKTVLVTGYGNSGRAPGFMATTPTGLTTTGVYLYPSLYIKSIDCKIEYFNRLTSSPTISKFSLECLEIYNHLPGSTSLSSSSIIYSAYNLKKLVIIDKATGENRLNLSGFSYGFYGCCKLKTIPTLNIVSSECSCAYGFYNCGALSEINFTWESTAALSYTNSIFSNCTALQTINGGFRFSRWTGTSALLAGCLGIRNVSVSFRSFSSSQTTFSLTNSNANMLEKALINELPSNFTTLGVCMGAGPREAYIELANSLPVRTGSILYLKTGSYFYTLSANDLALFTNKGWTIS